MKTLSLILLLASMSCATARELQVGDVISWEVPGSGIPRSKLQGRITQVSRQVGRPTYILVRQFGINDTWQLWRENRPMLIAATNEKPK